MQRRLQLLATENKLLNTFLEVCLHGPSSALDFGPTTKEGSTMDASGIINVWQDADESPREEDAEMERWRMMCECLEF